MSTFLFKALKSLGIFFNLSIPSLSTSDFKLAKSVFLAKSYVPTHVALFKSAIVTKSDKSNSTFKFPFKDLGLEKYSLIYSINFLSIQLLQELSWPFHLTYILSPFILITFFNS